MHVPGRGPLWVVRTALLAAASSGLAWAGHTVGGQGQTEPGSFLAATALMGLLLARFTRRRWVFGEIFAVLAVAQIGLHLLFELSAPAPALPHAGHGVHLLAPATGYSPGMLLGHLWAALVGAALLGRGESALWALCALLFDALPRLYRAPRPSHPPAPLRRPWNPAVPAVLGGVPLPHRPRGPPGVRHHFS